MDEMANAPEVISELATKKAYLEILVLAQDCKDLDELKEKLKAKAQ